MAGQKVKFGIKNAYYSKVTVNGDNVSYATPKRLSGAVSLSLSPVGDDLEFYADDIMYFGEKVNNGYDGTLELAMVPSSFREEILGVTKNEDGVYEENATSPQSSFALLCEFTTDNGAKKFAFYNCMASRTDLAASTKTASKEVQTETLNLTIRPNADGLVVRYTDDQTSSEVVEGWYSEVYEG